MQAEVRGFSWVSHLRAGTPALGSSSFAFPGHKEGVDLDVETAGTQTGAHYGMLVPRMEAWAAVPLFWLPQTLNEIK